MEPQHRGRARWSSLTHFLALGSRTRGLLDSIGVVLKRRNSRVGRAPCAWCAQPDPEDVLVEMEYHRQGTSEGRTCALYLWGADL